MSANLIFYSSITKVQQYEEDCKHEREDRTGAVEERLRIENEFRAYKEDSPVPSTGKAHEAQFLCMGEHNSGLVC